ncbi:MAG TPA: hypothetical protein VHS06_05615, partial [Chloroflexota bacterium]|nr:hypothetical protein [Chloroflexota bacterium]
MTFEADLRECVIAWRRAEDLYYRSVLQEPSLYTSSINLVRAIADSLAEITELAALVGEYRVADPELVATIADSLELPHREFIDYDLALDAGYYLRYQEIAEIESAAEIRDRIEKARSEGDEWVVLYDNKTRSRGHTYFERLEMQLSNGIGLRTSSELDWEKGRIFTVEPINLDPETGQMRRGVRSSDPMQEFTTLGEMAAAVEALRVKYSGTGRDATDAG